MKDKMILGSLALLTISASGYLYYSDTDTCNGLSEIQIAHIEALSTDEATPGGTTCYNSITTKEGSKILYCSGCIWVDGTYSLFSGTGKCTPTNTP